MRFKKYKDFRFDLIIERLKLNLYQKEKNIKKKL